MHDRKQSRAELIAEVEGLRARVAELEAALDARPRPLAEAERPSQLLFECNPFPMWIFDAETLEFLAVNDAATQHYGYARDEFLRMKITDIRPAEDLPALLQQLESPYPQPRTTTHNWRHRKKDGSLIYADVISYPLIFESRPAKIVLATDVTQRRRVELALDGQRRFFELLASGGDLGDVLAGLARSIEAQLGDGICSIMLLDQAGATLQPIAAPSLPEPYFQMLAASGVPVGPAEGSCGTAAFRGEPVVVTDIATDPLWENWREATVAHGLLACWSIPFRDSRGHMLGTFAVFYRETRAPIAAELDELKNAAYLAAVAVEHKRGEEALRASEARYRLASRVTNDVIWEWDANVGTLRWSDWAETIFGYTADQIGTYASWWDERLHPADRDRAVTSVTAALEDGAISWSAEYRFRRADGTYASILDRAYIIREADGRAVRMIGAMQDISQRSRAEAEIRRLNEELERRVAERTAQLEAANRELEAFSYSVSHDLRAPLRHVDGFARLLAQREAGRLDETSARYLRIVGDSARRMGQLIDDLLSFSRMSRTEMQHRAVNLDQLVADVRYELAPQCEGRAIAWDVAPLPVACGDPAMIRIVLANLLSNAIKYTAPRPQARISISAADTADGEFVVAIRDNGVGFDMQYVHKLFGVFQRLHRDEEFEGTGIGLATVRRIINRHGGRVWAEGWLDAGAAFHFTLKRHGQE
jgi:PAS domain S-box-containing protein